MDMPIQEIVQTPVRTGMFDIIPATLRGIKELNLSRTQICMVLFGGMVCGTATAFYYISKKNDEDIDSNNTIGASVKQDRDTEVHVEDVNVDRTRNSTNGNVTGLKADATDNAKLSIKSINVSA